MLARALLAAAPYVDIPRGTLPTNKGERMKRRLIALVLSAILALGALTACGGDTGTGTGTGTGDTGTGGTLDATVTATAP